MSRKSITFREVRTDVASYLQYIQTHRHPLSLLLDGVLDVRNIGALFRLADAARLATIYFYRMEKVQWTHEFRRVARATEGLVPVEWLDSYEAVQTVAASRQLCALEWTNDSVPYREAMPRQPCVLAIGNEESGVSEEILQLAEQCLHIPMYGIKTSMNVAVATGIAVYDFIEKLQTME